LAASYGRAGSEHAQTGEGRRLCVARGPAARSGSRRPLPRQRSIPAVAQKACGTALSLGKGLCDSMSSVPWRELEQGRRRMVGAIQCDCPRAGRTHGSAATARGSSGRETGGPEHPHQARRCLGHAGADTTALRGREAGAFRPGRRTSGRAARRLCRMCGPWGLRGGLLLPISGCRP
jgi:hypothetical protein